MLNPNGSKPLHSRHLLSKLQAHLHRLTLPLPTAVKETVQHRLPVELPVESATAPLKSSPLHMQGHRPLSATTTGPHHLLVSLVHAIDTGWGY
jgi:hypothetical protein